jgi:hypothetical protein
MSSSVPALAVVIALLLAACGTPAVSPAAAPSSATPTNATTTGLPPLVLIKSPTCGCCGGHETYLRAGGMDVRVEVSDDVAGVKERLGIPAEMRSCHTSLSGGYFVEGHVPLAAIERLLRERPEIDGIALPGMPPGSPGMGGVLEGPLTVYAIDDGQVVGVFGDF